MLYIKDALLEKKNTMCLAINFIYNQLYISCNYIFWERQQIKFEWEKTNLAYKKRKIKN